MIIVLVFEKDVLRGWFVGMLHKVRVIKKEFF